nr:hypothetical protein [Tanacetum cinerariifolium]
MMKNVFGLRCNCRELKGIVKLRFCRLVTMILQWLKDEQPKENTNTNCLVKEQEKEYQTGWKIKTGIQQQNGLVDETNVTLFAKMCMCSATVAGNAVMTAISITRGIHQISATKGLLDKAKGNVLGIEIVKDQSGYTLRCHNLGFTTESCQEYQMVYTILDIASTDVGMLDKFDRGLQTDVYVFVDFDYAMGRSIIVMESRYELRLVAGIATGALVKGDSRSEVPTQVEVAAYRTNFVPPPNNGDDVVCFVLYDLAKPQVPSCFEQLDHVEGLLHDEHGGFTLSLLDSLFLKRLRTIKSIPSKCRLGFSQVLKGALDKFAACERDLAKSSPHMLDVDEEDLDLSERNLKLCKRKIYDGHYTTIVRVLSSSGIAPYNDAILKELKAKHPFKSAPSFPDIHIDHHRLIASKAVVLDRIKNELVSSITQVVNLFLDGKCPMMLGEYIASASLTPLVKPGGSIHSIAVGTVWRRLVFKAILHAVNRLIDNRGDDVGLSMLLVDFKNAFNLVDQKPDYTIENTPYGHAKGWKMLELIMEHGRHCGLHLNVDKNEIFWPKEDPRSMFEGVFSPNISRSLHGVKLIGVPVSVDFDFSSELVMKRVSKTIRLMDAVANINDPQASDALTYAFLASRLRSPVLQTKLLRHVGIVTFGSTFDGALCVINTSMELDLLSYPSEIVSPKLMKKMADIYFTRPCSACSRVFAGDIYGYHDVSCADIIGIKHYHNVVRNTIIDICFRLRISVGKVVDIGLDEGCDKPLRPTYMLLYSWDGGLDVCVDLIGSLPLTQTGMADFVSGRAVIDVEQWELEEDAVTLLKRI